MGTENINCAAELRELLLALLADYGLTESVRQETLLKRDISQFPTISSIPLPFDDIDELCEEVNWPIPFDLVDKNLFNLLNAINSAKSYDDKGVVFIPFPIFGGRATLEVGRYLNYVIIDEYEILMLDVLYSAIRQIPLKHWRDMATADADLQMPSVSDLISGSSKISSDIVVSRYRVASEEGFFERNSQVSDAFVEALCSYLEAIDSFQCTSCQAPPCTVEERICVLIDPTPNREVSHDDEISRAAAFVFSYIFKIASHELMHLREGHTADPTESQISAMHGVGAVSFDHSMFQEIEADILNLEEWYEQASAVGNALGFRPDDPMASAGTMMAGATHFLLSETITRIEVGRARTEFENFLDLIPRSRWASQFHGMLNHMPSNLERLNQASYDAATVAFLGENPSHAHLGCTLSMLGVVCAAGLASAVGEKVLNDPPKDGFLGCASCRQENPFVEHIQSTSRFVDYLKLHEHDRNAIERAFASAKSGQEKPFELIIFTDEEAVGILEASDALEHKFTEFLLKHE